MTAAREMYSRAAWTIGFALVLYYINHDEYPGPALQLAVVITLIGGVFIGLGYGTAWLAGPGRARVEQQLLDSLGLQGAERVLDLGSANGSLGIAAAQRLSNGKVIALGSAGSNEAGRVAAKALNLGDRIRFEPADLKKIPYPDGSFDCVIASDALFPPEVEARQMLAEAFRTLKPGGRISVLQTQAFQVLAGLPVETAMLPSPHPFGLSGRVATAQKRP
jgi:SAM-dependent methyltransferase